jgi:hypothetical protein
MELQCRPDQARPGVGQASARRRPDEVRHPPAGHRPAVAATSFPPADKEHASATPQGKVTSHSVTSLCSAQGVVDGPLRGAQPHTTSSGAPGQTLYPEPAQSEHRMVGASPPETPKCHA